ncbi:MAG: histidine phosphatase family protein [Acidimicrobiales bacterium]
MRIVIVRHGQTEWSRAMRHTGRTDIPLDATGRRQAERLRTRLVEHTFAHVMVSPLARAMETCRIAGFGGVAEVCPDLQEWDYGKLEGMTAAEIRKTSPGWSIWDNGALGGESIEEVAMRADRVVASLRAANGDVLVIAHAHLLRVLAARWIGCEPVGGRYLVLSPAAISILGHEREDPAILRWNDPGEMELG